jgi:hypothetical protein
MESTHAELEMEVGPSGGMRSELRLAPELEDELLPLARQVGQAVTPPDDVEVGIDGNDGGFDVAVISSDDAYPPGTNPSVAIRVGEGALDALAAAGIETLDLNFCAPYVPVDFQASIPPDSVGQKCALWQLVVGSGSLDALMAMHPQPSRWYRSIGLFAVTLVSSLAALVAYIRRRSSSAGRIRVAILAFPGAVALVVGAATLAAAPHGDNMGVAGKLDGFALGLATWVPVALLPLGLACVGLAIAALLQHHKQRGLHNLPPPPAWAPPMPPPPSA